MILSCNIIFTGLRFLVQPNSVSVEVGNTVSVLAKLRNAKQVYWCKGEDRVIGISTSFKEQYDTETGIAELILNSASLQDSGSYSCVAIHFGLGRSEIERSFFIFVHTGKISLSLSLSSLYF